MSVVLKSINRRLKAGTKVRTECKTMNRIMKTSHHNNGDINIGDERNSIKF